MAGHPILLGHISNRIRTTASIKLVRIVNFPSLLRQQTLVFNIASGKNFVAKTRSIKATSAISFDYHGELVNGTGEVALVYRHGAITGTISAGINRYQIHSLGSDIHALVTIDPSKYEPDEPLDNKSESRQLPDDLNDQAFDDRSPLL